MSLAVEATARAGAPPSPAVLPAACHDAAVPAPRDVLGHDLGEGLTPVEGVAAYLRALVAAAPTRARVLTYGHSHERRPLPTLVVAPPGGLDRLDDLQRDLRRLGDPRALGPEEAERLLEALPVVVWLMHGAHGDELAPAEAALAVAYHLLAARDDTCAASVARHALVLIDAAQNPDGRARFLAHHVQTCGGEADPLPIAAEHDAAWPGGRPNHDLFDLNRDWFALTQPESRARLRVARRWQPHVTIDVHDMAADSSYYFGPPGEPWNAEVTAEQRRWIGVFARANAERFDRLGLAYFARETYEAVYPGYGDSWPLYQGAVSLLFEAAAPRGLAQRRRDGAVLRLRDAVAAHVTALLCALETAALHRRALLRHFLEHRRQAASGPGEGGTRAYFLVPGEDPALAARLARLLVAQGIEVQASRQAIAHDDGRMLPAGTFAVALAQPAGHLVRALLDPPPPLPVTPRSVEVTAWALPRTWAVECLMGEMSAATPWLPVDETQCRPVPALPAARVGYVLPWGAGTAALVTEALGQGLAVRATAAPLQAGEWRFARGAALLRARGNPPELASRLAALAARHGTRVEPLDSGWSEEGELPGSDGLLPLAWPRLVLAWDSPTVAASAGWARFVLERRYGLRASIVRAASLGHVDWRQVDVLVLPAGDFAGVLGRGVLERLRGWVSEGGTLVTLAAASEWAAREDVALLTGAAPAVHAGQGALLRVTLDQGHWLCAGLPPRMAVQVRNGRTLAGGAGERVVVRYADGDGLLLDGTASPEALRQLAGSASVVQARLGHGQVVAFAEDPNFRGVTEATALLFFNAVLLGPAQRRR